MSPVVWCGVMWCAELSCVALLGVWLRIALHCVAIFCGFISRPSLVLLACPLGCGWCELFVDKCTHLCPDLLRARIPLKARLLVNGTVVEPSAASVGLALLDDSFHFGNNGDDPALLTADLRGDPARGAWPIAGLTYLVMRKATLRSGGTCDTVRETMQFWVWFWNSKTVQSIARREGFAPLPDALADQVMQRFVTDVTCDGRLAWNTKLPGRIRGTGTRALADALAHVSEAHGVSHPSMVVQYDPLEAAAGSLVCVPSQHRMADPCGGP